MKRKVSHLIILILCFVFYTAFAVEPTIEERLDSWLGHSLEEVCSTWCIVPDKSINISDSSVMYEFNYDVQTTKNGAYIPGGDNGYYDATKGQWVKNGNKPGGL